LDLKFMKEDLKLDKVINQGKQNIWKRRRLLFDWSENESCRKARKLEMD
jgi:hypothetical protein